MAFNSYDFFIFLGLLYPLFLIVRRWVGARNLFLLGASYFFYAMWDWRFLGLIALSTIVDYAVGLGFRGQAVGEAKRGPRQRLLLTVSVVTNLGILGVFKYYDFFAQSLVDLAGTVGWEMDPARLRVILPAGISFYTFQTMSYTIDLYRGKIGTERNLLVFATYVAYFPQLVAGPIERAAHLLPQFKRVLPITGGMFRLGCYLILMGLFKKVVLADNAAFIANATFGTDGMPDGLRGWEVWLGTYAFAIQIYCDFSGYSDIARGLGKIMGVDIMINFAMPYSARNPNAFWRRWHISLSTWLRDYLYIPLGGNRKGRARTYVNLMATMVLGGLWHGAAWTFVAWGVLHGVYLIGHRMLHRPLDHLDGALPRVLRPLWALACVVFFFHLVCVAWVFFRADTFADAAEMLGRMGQAITLGGGDWFAISNSTTLNQDDVTIFASVAACVLIGHLIGARFGPYFPLRWPVVLRGLWYAFLMFSIILFGVRTGEPFIYFEF
ncbi:MAG: membrane-bound O-acyltransferase family protein [Phycisphaeraceae bacterium]|nr:MAG: membrane-bound O-acyltransferase family protein [Phycisphaeraceae bacterium]